MSIDAIGVSHIYRGEAHPVIDDISLSIGVGQSIALTGPSGSGKTTFLSILGLLLMPTRGVIHINGTQIAGSAARIEARRQVYSWVFQTANVLGGRSSVDNAALGLIAKGWSHDAARDRALAALSIVGLGAISSRPAHSLSGGELQRVSIARAIAAGPTCILADEPTGQLDRATSDVVIDALVRARESGMSVVVATHDLVLANRCDRHIAIENGRCIEF